MRVSAEEARRVIRAAEKEKDSANDLLKKGRYEDAHRQYSEALEAVEGIEVVKGGDSDRSGEGDEGGFGEDDMNTATQLQLSLLSNLCLCAMKKQAFEKAIEYGERVLSSNPNHLKCLLRTASSHLSLSECMQATVTPPTSSSSSSSSSSSFVSDVREHVSAARVMLRRLFAIGEGLTAADQSAAVRLDERAEAADEKLKAMQEEEEKKRRKKEGEIEGENERKSGGGQEGEEEGFLGGLSHAFRGMFGGKQKAKKGKSKAIAKQGEEKQVVSSPSPSASPSSSSTSTSSKQREGEKEKEERKNEKEAASVGVTSSLRSLPLRFVFRPADPPSAVVIFLHGFASNSINFMRFASSLHLPQCSLLSLQGPIEIPFSDDMMGEGEGEGGGKGTGSVRQQPLPPGYSYSKQAPSSGPCCWVRTYDEDTFDPIPPFHPLRMGSFVEAARVVEDSVERARYSVCVNGRESMSKARKKSREDGRGGRGGRGGGRVVEVEGGSGKDGGDDDEDDEEEEEEEEEVWDRPLPPSSIFLVGFSEGAAIALEAVMSYEKRGVSIGGAILVSPMVFEEMERDAAGTPLSKKKRSDHIKKEGESASSPSSTSSSVPASTPTQSPTSTPLLILHGHHDEEVGKGKVENLSRVIREERVMRGVSESEASAQIRYFNKGHEMISSGEEARAFHQFLSQHLPLRTPSLEKQAVEVKEGELKQKVMEDERMRKRQAK
eukprot:CAMPEP_0113908154 /NCGR_PEP_ID=MMETSP0780_2-20120614/25972_1 /TAXON_ID=652834 /ORGANISM="Palpitomonas bilix" /LENGTH=718 /DNA_ID=CAMNT_0000903487 /DNA_START=86 /DNA_END=2242 /DNA_ORIENTATION=+ /assembly_acc=CAM_ASM_000599